MNTIFNHTTENGFFYDKSDKYKNVYHLYDKDHKYICTFTDRSIDIVTSVIFYLISNNK